MKRPPIVNILIIVFIGLLSSLSGILSNLASNQIPPQTIPYLRFTWPLLGMVTLALLGATIWQTLRQSSIDTLFPKSKHIRQSIEKQNRQRMLARVHFFWISGILMKSLYNEVLITLDLCMQPDAVTNPWRLALQESIEHASSLPPGTRITKVYDQANGELLILGEPGSGKTTLLLELTRDLLERARQDTNHPIPVVFNLSSWAVERKPLTDWFTEELYSKYQIPRSLGKSWVDTNQVLPLLDGLDEVTSEHQADCVEAINNYRQEHGLIPTVVCSRSGDYLTQTTQLLLHRAVVVQPLTELQIDDYLASAKGQLEAVRVVLHNDHDLQKLATTPLMLSILTVAYYGKSVEDLKKIIFSKSQPWHLQTLLILPQLRRDALRQQIFKNYLERVLKHRGVNSQYTLEQIVHWLTWLAQQMTQHSQTVFYIERIQPNWLSKYWLLRRILFVPSSVFVFRLFVLLSFILIFLLIAFSGVWGLLFFEGYIYLILFVLAFSDPQKEEIKPVEVIHWSWNKRDRLFAQKIPWFLSVFFVMCGIVVAYFLGPMVMPSLTKLCLSTLNSCSNNDLELVFLVVTFTIITFFLLFLVNLTSGFKIEELDEHERLRPNQGIWYSARISMLIGSPFGLVSGTVVALIVSMSVEGLGITLVCGLIGGLIIALLVGLFCGGLACIQHFVLRFLLWRNNYIPWNYSRFLDFAAERILLRKAALPHGRILPWQERMPHGKSYFPGDFRPVDL